MSSSDGTWYLFCQEVTDTVRRKRKSLIMKSLDIIYDSQETNNSEIISYRPNINIPIIEIYLILKEKVYKIPPLFLRQFLVSINVSLLYSWDSF